MSRATTIDSSRNARRSSAAPPLPTKEKISTDENSNSLCVTFTKDEKERMTPYEKLLYESEYDVRVHAEEKAGRRIGFYRLRGNIGLGNFSKVKLGFHLLARGKQMTALTSTCLFFFFFPTSSRRHARPFAALEKVAVKILDRTKLNKSTQKLLLREIKTIERLHHPHIIRLYEVIETSTEYYIITEYAPGGELYTRITSGGKLDESQAKLLFAQLVSAVDHMVKNLSVSPFDSIVFLPFSTAKESSIVTSKAKIFSSSKKISSSWAISVSALSRKRTKCYRHSAAVHRTPLRNCIETRVTAGSASISGRWAFCCTSSSPV